jgi:hypothetical protein
VPPYIDIPAVDLVTDDTTFGDNILVPYEELCSFMENFVCVDCHEPISELTKSSVGIATTILNVCSCGKKSSIKPEMVPPPQGQSDNGNYRRRISAYALNVRLLLLTHLIGGSRTAALSICCMLALTSSLFDKSWYGLEDSLGVHIRAVTDQIVKENVKEELSGLLANELGYYDVDVSGDGGWQTGGRSFDSISGHSMLIGKRFEKIIAFANYAKKCRKCEDAAKKERTVEEHNCPKNYEGSSKGMECFGLMECVLKLHNEFNICVRKFVLDDDSTTRAYIKHSYQALIDAGRMNVADWPRSKDGKRKKTDSGRLPLTHTLIEFIADINHRVRTFGGYLWKLEKNGKKRQS